MGQRDGTDTHSEIAPTVATVLVDTSLLIEQQKGPRLAKPVRQALARFRFRGASSYSKLEIKRAWAKRLAYIHGLCQRSDVASILDVWEQFNKLLGAHPGNRRKVETCQQQLIAFLRDQPSTLSERAKLVRLRAHCKNAVLSLYEAVQETITGEFYGTKCVRAAEAPRECADGSLDVTIRRCKPEKIQCTVHTFFEEHREAFRAVARFVDQNSMSSEELRQMRDHIRKAERDPVHLCDDKHCCRLADMLIACDGKNMDTFAANNDREWIPIAEIMGKPLLNPVRDARHPNKNSTREG